MLKYQLLDSRCQDFCASIQRSGDGFGNQQLLQQTEIGEFARKC